ncbi:MAG: type II toxin-antitoxin system RelE/ParE family toxin [Actinomycetota bacterium]
MTSLIYTPDAIVEVRAVHDWYERQSPGVGRAFLDELALAEKAISRSPVAFKVMRRGTRRYFLRRFPYQLLFTIRDDVIVVVACLHARRSPRAARRRAH